MSNEEIIEQVREQVRQLIDEKYTLLRVCELAVETIDDDAPGPGTTEKDLLRQLRAAIALARRKTELVVMAKPWWNIASPSVVWDAGYGWVFEGRQTSVGPWEYGEPIHVFGFFSWALTDEQLVEVHKHICAGTFVKGHYDSWAQFKAAHRKEAMG